VFARSRTTTLNEKRVAPWHSLQPAVRPSNAAVKRAASCAVIASCSAAILRGELRDRVGQRHRRILVLRMERDGVGEAFLELVGLVRRELPVAGVAAEPELGVAHLLQRHDLAETRCVAVGSSGLWLHAAFVAMVTRTRGSARR